MNRGSVVAAALMSVAALSDWAFDALYFERDAPHHIIGALMLNALAVGVLLALVARILGARLGGWLCSGVLLMLAGIMAYDAVRPAVPWLAHVPRMALLAATAALIGGGAWANDRLGVDRWRRIERALTAGALAYSLSPLLLTWMQAPTLSWPPVAQAQPSLPDRSNIVFLLLDELGDMPSRPMATDLRRSGFEVAESSLAASGADTIHVIPQMFTRHDFSQAKPCGPGTICSGSSMLDFERIVASRPDVDVVGMYHPYCRIRGLRSCSLLTAPARYRNAYFALVNHYLSRLGHPLQNAALEIAVSKGLKAELVKVQNDALMSAPFWRDGGLLYGHIPLPHPPGLAGWGALDADYASNLEAARGLVSQVAVKARQRFGADVTIIITSDHPLRSRIWCSASPFNPYRKMPCEVRAEFSTTRVPLIIAQAGKSPRLLSLRSNMDVFDAMIRPAPAD